MLVYLEPIKIILSSYGFTIGDKMYKWPKQCEIIDYGESVRVKYSDIYNYLFDKNTITGYIKHKRILYRHIRATYTRRMEGFVEEYNISKLLISIFENDCTSMLQMCI